MSEHRAITFHEHMARTRGRASTRHLTYFPTVRLKAVSGPLVHCSYMRNGEILPSWSRDAPL